MPVDVFFKFYVIFVQKNKIWEQTKHFEKVLVKKKIASHLQITCVKYIQKINYIKEPWNWN
jgi:hypothetical protein